MNYKYFIALEGIDKDFAKYGNKYDKREEILVTLDHMIEEEDLKKIKSNSFKMFTDINQKNILTITLLHSFEEKGKVF